MGLVLGEGTQRVTVPSHADILMRFFESNKNGFETEAQVRNLDDSEPRCHFGCVM
jgi:hypothetical protein